MVHHPPSSRNVRLDEHIVQRQSSPATKHLRDGNLFIIVEEMSRQSYLGEFELMVAVDQHHVVEHAVADRPVEMKA